MANMMMAIWVDETGLETVEYAIILGIIVVASIVFLASIGGWVQNQYRFVAERP